MPPGDVYWKPERRGFRIGPWLILLIVVGMWLAMMPYTKPPTEPSVEMASSSIVEQPEKAVPVTTTEPVHILNPSSASLAPLQSTTSNERAEPTTGPRRAASSYQRLRQELLGRR